MKDKKCLFGKPLVVGIVAITIFTYIFDMLVHGMLMLPLYQQSAYAWRPMNEMRQMVNECLAYHFFQALAVTIIFVLFTAFSSAYFDETKMRDEFKRKYAYKISFGFWLGVLVGVNAASTYIWMPIPGIIAILWLAISVVKFMLISMILSCIMCTEKCEIKKPVAKKAPAKKSRKK